MKQISHFQLIVTWRIQLKVLFYIDKLQICFHVFMYLFFFSNIKPLIIRKIREKRSEIWVREAKVEINWSWQKIKCKSEICALISFLQNSKNFTFKGFHLEKIKEKGSYVKYKIMTKMVYFYRGEVFSPSVPIDENLSIPISVYLSLAEIMLQWVSLI